MKKINVDKSYEQLIEMKNVACANIVDILKEHCMDGFSYRNIAKHYDKLCHNNCVSEDVCEEILDTLNEITCENIFDLYHEDGATYECTLLTIEVHDNEVSIFGEGVQFNGTLHAHQGELSVYTALAVLNFLQQFF